MERYCQNLALLCSPTRASTLVVRSTLPTNEDVYE